MFSKLERKVAFRYLGAKKRGFGSVISWVSLIGIMLGVATLIVVMSVMGGFHDTLLGRIVGMNGHVVVYHQDGAISDFDYLIDKIKCKFGRRKMGLLIGVIPTIITFVLFLIPLNNSATILNTVWFGVILCLFYSFYTLTMLTYYATFREVCATEKDVMFLSNVKSIFDVVYFSLGFALIPLFIGMKLNIRVIALIFLPLSLTMLIPFFMLKENKDEENTKTNKANNKNIFFFKIKIIQ